MEEWMLRKEWYPTGEMVEVLDLVEVAQPGGAARRATVLDVRMAPPQLYVAYEGEAGAVSDGKVRLDQVAFLERGAA